MLVGRSGFGVGSARKCQMSNEIMADKLFRDYSLSSLSHINVSICGWCLLGCPGLILLAKYGKA